jgi:hypothetical protein
MLRGVFGPKREEVTRGWRNLHNEELHNCTLHLALQNDQKKKKKKKKETGWACGTNEGDVHLEL